MVMAEASLAIEREDTACDLWGTHYILTRRDKTRHGCRMQNGRLCLKWTLDTANGCGDVRCILSIMVDGSLSLLAACGDFMLTEPPIEPCRPNQAFSAPENRRYGVSM